LRVVAHDEEQQIVRSVIAVARESLRWNVAERRAPEFLQQRFAVQDLHAVPASLVDVDCRFARARLGERALHELLVDAAPHPHLDAVFFLERRDHWARVLRCLGGVESCSVFFLIYYGWLRSPIS